MKRESGKEKEKKKREAKLTHCIQAKVTDLLPETQKYLVVFVEYGNSQGESVVMQPEKVDSHLSCAVCTDADLAPLDTVVTKAAPVPLDYTAEEKDPLVLEAERQARIAERQKQLKAEEEERQRVLEEKRRAAAERKAKLEELDREEKRLQIEEQRAKLEKAQREAATAAGVSVAQTPVSPGRVVTAEAPPPKMEPSTPAEDDKRREKRLALGKMGGSASKMGIKSVTLAEMREVARNSPLRQPEFEEKNDEPKETPPQDNFVTAEAVKAELAASTTVAAEESSSGDDLEEEASETLAHGALSPPNRMQHQVGGNTEDTLVAMDALRDLAVAEGSINDEATTTMILSDLRDDFPDDLESDLRRAAAERENAELDAMLNGLTDLRGETARVGSSAASDLGDLEAEARRLLGE